VADSDETEKVSDSVDAEKVTADATKNAGTAAVKAPMTAKEANTETVDKTSCEFKCKEWKEEFENVKDMRALEMQVARAHGDQQSYPSDRWYEWLIGESWWKERRNW
jgi:hypothetical protein